MIEVKDASSFDVEVMESDIPVVVYFTAQWCGPCKALRPILEKVEVEFGEKAKFVKVDVDIDANRETVADFSVRGIPTLALVKYGVVVDTSVGARSQAQLSAWLMSNL